MTVPRKPTSKQAPRTTPTVDLALTFPDNDPRPYPGSGPDRCPYCGRPYFGPASSQLLDLVVSAHTAIADVKAALEAVVIP